MEHTVEMDASQIYRQANQSMEQQLISNDIDFHNIHSKFIKLLVLIIKLNNNLSDNKPKHLLYMLHNVCYVDSFPAFDVLKNLNRSAKN